MANHFLQFQLQSSTARIKKYQSGLFLQGGTIICLRRNKFTKIQRSRRRRLGRMSGRRPRWQKRSRVFIQKSSLNCSLKRMNPKKSLNLVPLIQEYILSFAGNPPEKKARKTGSHSLLAMLIVRIQKKQSKFKVMIPTKLSNHQSLVLGITLITREKLN